MKIERNKHVTLTYDLRSNGVDGELVESTTVENPLVFIFGAGKMLPRFEENIEGLAAGAEFKFELAAVDAYGEINEEAVVDLPKNIFEVNGEIEESLLAIGNNIPMMDAHGRRLNGIVLEVDDTNVRMDFNHPLAGDSLHFSGKIVAVRDASDEEIMALVNGAGGGCGCSSGGGCGSESGGCGSGGCGDDEGDSCCSSSEKSSGGCGCGC